jgi:hypothetical protein
VLLGDPSLRPRRRLPGGAPASRRGQDRPFRKREHRRRRIQIQVSLPVMSSRSERVLAVTRPATPFPVPKRES